MVALVDRGVLLNVQAGPGATAFAGVVLLTMLSARMLDAQEADRYGLMAMDLAGFAVSAGSACSSGKVTRSAVLLAMGVEPAEAETALRISFGWNTVSEDIERLIAAWRDLYIRVGRSDIDQARAA